MNIEEFEFNQNNIEEVIENIINKISAWKKQPVPSDVWNDPKLVDTFLFS